MMCPRCGNPPSKCSHSSRDVFAEWSPTAEMLATNPNPQFWRNAMAISFERERRGGDHP